MSCENYPAFLMMAQAPYLQIAAKSLSGQSSGLSEAQKLRLAPSRSALRKMVQQRLRLKDGRWFLTLSFASMGPALDEPGRAMGQARLLLQRYGILVKEWYRREQGLLPWHKIFQALKRLEWQGEIRRGYFVNGLSGVQFAMPAAQYEKFAKLLHHLLKLPQPLRSKKRLEISRINNQPAAASPFAEHFINNGFEKDGEGLVLWPSHI